MPFQKTSGQNYLGKKAKFVTLVIDLDSGHVLWIGEGRGKAALEGFWPKLQGSKAKISAVACDMSAAYWAAVIEHLPDAAIVFDHFHIIKLANEAIDEVRRGLQRTLDMIGCKAIKGTRYLLLRGKENLTPEQQPTLEEALKWNEPLSAAYYLKEELRELWQHPDHASAASALQAWICKAMSTELGPMKRLAKTLLSHAKGVLNYFIHPICQHGLRGLLAGHLAALGCSGMMEGINNKIGRLTRLAY